MKYSIVDLHMHVVPNYDDGAEKVEESIEMLKMSQEQGVTDVFCTSHNCLGYEDSELYNKQFESLKDMARQQGITINLHKGCEILTCDMDVDHNLSCIEKGYFSTLGDSKFVLIELYPDTKPSEATLIVKKVNNKGYVPVIAHMERNYNLSEMMVGLLIQLGALVQVNAFSFVEEKNSLIKARARNLLNKKFIHFIGSDSHRIDHRPPKIISAVEYIINNVEEEYALAILSANAKKMILQRG